LNADDRQVIDEYLMELQRRIKDLEGCLNYVRNFVPPDLKQHVESVLWPDSKSA
jgi:hypothetical protein